MNTVNKTLYVITVAYDVKSSRVYGTFSSKQEALDFLNDEKNKLYFADTDFVNVEEVRSLAELVEDFSEDTAEDVVEDDEAVVPVVSADTRTVDERKYSSALRMFMNYSIAKNVSEVLSMSLSGRNVDEEIEGQFWDNPDAAIVAMIDDPDFSLVKSYKDVLSYPHWKDFETKFKKD